MPTLDRKQRERQEREEFILQTARKILLQEGYFGLTMDKVARATEYSKGTIYQHFGSKEEIIAELSIRITKTALEFFEKAATFPGRPRERMCAIGLADELCFRLHPHDLTLVGCYKDSEIMSKVPQAKLDRLQAHDDGIFEICNHIVREAIAQGDLVPRQGMTPQLVTFGLWSLTFGAYSIIRSCRDLQSRHGIEDPFAALRRQCHVLMDGLSWKPLSHEWDYEAVIQRLCRTTFAEECARLPART